MYYSQIKDEAFDETEKRFRLQERLIKSFIRDISLYLQHIRVRQKWSQKKSDYTQMIFMPRCNYENKSF